MQYIVCLSSATPYKGLFGMQNHRMKPGDERREEIKFQEAKLFAPNTGNTVTGMYEMEIL